MTIRRITIIVPETLAEEIKKAAGDRSVWLWVQEVLEERLADEELNRQWEEFYMDVSPGPEAIKQADEMFERLTMPTTREHMHAMTTEVDRVNAIQAPQLPDAADLPTHAGTYHLNRLRRSPNIAYVQALSLQLQRRSRGDSAASPAVLTIRWRPHCRDHHG